MKEEQKDVERGFETLDFYQDSKIQLISILQISWKFTQI